MFLILFVIHSLCMVFRISGFCSYSFYRFRVDKASILFEVALVGLCLQFFLLQEHLL